MTCPHWRALRTRETNCSGNHIKIPVYNPALFSWEGRGGTVWFFQPFMSFSTTFHYCENDAVWENNQNFKNTGRNAVAEDKTQNKLTQTSWLYVLTTMQTYTLVPIEGARYIVTRVIGSAGQQSLWLHTQTQQPSPTSCTVDNVEKNIFFKAEGFGYTIAVWVNSSNTRISLCILGLIFLSC